MKKNKRRSLQNIRQEFNMENLIGKIIGSDEYKKPTMLKKVQNDLNTQGTKSKRYYNLHKLLFTKLSQLK